MYAKYSPQCLNQGSQTTYPPKQAIQGDKTPKTNLNLIGNQGKSFELKSFMELTCYRCRGQGHIAKDYPTKKDSPNPEPTPCRHFTLQHDQVQTKTCQIDYNVSMTVVTHLSSAKSVEKVSGTKEIITDQGDSSTMEKLFPDQSQNQGESTPMLNEVSVKEDESVSDTIQIKEEPPDSQPIDQTR
ncbi:unnamed protein product, partial [Arabidopsis halleri]